MPRRFATSILNPPSKDGECKTHGAWSFDGCAGSGGACEVGLGCQPTKANFGSEIWSRPPLKLQDEPPRRTAQCHQFNVLVPCVRASVRSQMQIELIGAMGWARTR